MPKDNNDPETGLDADALSAIRAMLTDEPPVAPLVAPKREVPQPNAKAAQQAAPAPQEFSAPDPLIADTLKNAKPDQPPKRILKMPVGMPSLAGLKLTGLKERLMAYRPSKSHLIIGACALMVLLRPWLVIGLFALLIFITAGIFLVLGYDGFWRRAMALGRWYARRRPARAAVIHRKLDSFAMKWDGILDRFPEGTVDGLYLPDFGELATADHRHEAAMDKRLSGLRES